MSKTLNEVKEIWKKSFLEATEKNFSMVEQTAAEACACSPADINTNKVQAAMAHFQATMEQQLKENGLTKEDEQIIKEHGKEWIMESIDWVTNLIIAKTNMKEKMVTVGGKKQ